MYKVNILTKVKYKSFGHVFNAEKYGNYFEVYENSTDDIVWDIIVVYEGCDTPRNIKYREGGLLFISGEPPLSRVYPRQFIKQFDVFHTTHNIKGKNVEHGHLAINWHFSMSFKNKTQRYDFNELKHLSVPTKTKAVSIITSNKRMMPGHNKRRNLIERLKADFGDAISYYGDGINNVEYKCDALLPYYFHICMENTNVTDYWTEKFSDPLLGYCIPIYVGCPNIDDYFESDGFIKINYEDYERTKLILTEILNNPQRIYDKYYHKMLVNRNRLLENYTLFDLIYEKVKSKDLKNASIFEKRLLPYESCRFYKVDFLLMRIYRFLLKIYINKIRK